MKTSPMKCHMPPHESPISRMKRWVSFISIILFYKIWYSLFLMTRVDSKLLLARVVYFKQSWSVCIICYDYPFLGNTIKTNHLCLAWLDFCFKIGKIDAFVFDSGIDWSVAMKHTNWRTSNLYDRPIRKFWYVTFPSNNYRLRSRSTNERRKLK